MAQQLKTVDDYDRFVNDRLASLTPQQRIALASAMGERWYPAYASFAKAEQWGDSSVLRRSLDAIWNHLRGTPLGGRERDRLIAEVDAVTPHMDDFDADEALSACVIVKDALRCTAKSDNIADAYDAMTSAFNAVAPDWFMAEDEQPRLWRQAGVQKEVAKKLQLLELVAETTHFDDSTIATLRQRATSRELVGELRRRKATTTPQGRSNKELFEQYRGAITSDTRKPRSRMNIAGNDHLLFAELVSAWGGRYQRRKQFLDGTMGKPADTQGRDAVVRRNQTRDAATPGAADWPEDVRFLIDTSYQNRALNYGAPSPDAPHAYGPSLRRLWIEARQRGAATHTAIIDALDSWGQHHPVSWAVEDRRRKKGSPEAKAAAALGETLVREISWENTADVDFPWSARVEESHWRVRINDFPDEPMYSLEIDGTVAGDFHDWPDSWVRP